jgi:lysophospholipase L1-like esterase
VDGLEGVVGLDAGGDQTCARTGDGVSCWGAAGEGVPAPPTRRVEGAVAALAVGVDVVCVAAGDGAVRCFESNAFGQLGDGDAPHAGATAVAVRSWDDGRLRDRDGDGRLRVVCVGDSNTAPETGLTKWCERLADLLPPPFELVNRGLGGATATAGIPMLDGSDPLRYALESDRPDAVILALGSNDVIVGVETEAIVAALHLHARHIYESGAVAFVASAPPLYGAHARRDDAQRALNEALRHWVAPDRLVDFDTGFGRDDFVDDIHVGPSGQQRRAERAAAVLLRAAGMEQTP